MPQKKYDLRNQFEKSARRYSNEEERLTQLQTVIDAHHKQAQMQKKYKLPTFDCPACHAKNIMFAGDAVAKNETILTLLEENGVVVSDKATAGGVTLPCNDIYITKRLDEESCGMIERSAQSLLGNDRRGIALAKAIYQKAGLELDLPAVETIVSSLFTNSSGYKLNQSSEYYKIVVPTLYGGYNSKGNDDKKGNRNQFIDYILMAGDILVCKEGTTYGLYMCVGEGKIVDLNASKPEICQGDKYKKIVYSVYGQDVYAVLRPCAN